MKSKKGGSPIVASHPRKFDWTLIQFEIQDVHNALCYQSIANNLSSNSRDASVRSNNLPTVVIPMMRLVISWEQIPRTFRAEEGVISGSQIPILQFRLIDIYI